MLESISYDNSSCDPPCFVAGTRISTIDGAVEVQHLAVGDMVSTRSGVTKPVRWIAHRTINCRLHPRPYDVFPVRIAAHAFGENRPSRDLFVSPGHAICVDMLGEVLIPAVALINGSNVQQVEVDKVTYWHVELDEHDIILAENMPTESYLDMGNRAFFEGAQVVSLAASPDADPALYPSADLCHPFHDGGAVVEAARLQLDRRGRGDGMDAAQRYETRRASSSRRDVPGG